MDKDFVWAIELNRRSLELIGLWPNMNEIIKRRVGSDIRAGFTIISLTIFLAIPLIYALIRVWGDMGLMIENLRITIPVLTLLLKFIIMRYKQSGMSRSIWYI